MGFLPSEIARLVLGYLEGENCMQAYTCFLNSSPNLSECRARNFTRHLMGYSLVDILNEFGAIQTLLSKNKSAELRSKLRKRRNNIDKIVYLLEHATCPHSDCSESSQVDVEDKSTNTHVVTEDSGCQTDILIQKIEKFDADVPNGARNGLLPALPELECLKCEVDGELPGEARSIFVANVPTEGLEENFIEMLKPGTIVSTENISPVQIDVVYLDTANEGQGHEQTSLPSDAPCELDLERLETMNAVRKTEESEVKSAGSEYSLDVYVSDFDSEMNLNSDDPLMEEQKLKFQCDVCNGNFDNKQDLEDHINSAHELNPPGSLSERNTDGNNIETLNAAKMGHVYICDVCKKAFKKRYYLVGHIQNTHERIRKACSKCDAKFSTKYQLYKHMKNVHELIKDVNVHKCEPCNRTFTLKYLCQIHMNEVHALNIEQFQCKHCSRTYPTRLKLRKHVWYMHTNNGEYGCEFCQKVYLSKVQLTRHKQYSHSKDGSRVKCQRCRKTFGSTKQLTRHTKEVHQNLTLKFACQVCSESFRLRKDLDVHCFHKHSKRLLEAAKSNNVLRPMGNVLMKCSQCEKAFKSERQLENHYKKSHATDGVTCTVCSKTFATKYRMDMHVIRTHSVNGQTFICLKCMKVFETKYQLTSHTTTVHGEKKFCCQHCGRAFSLKKSLTRHLNGVHGRRGRLKKTQGKAKGVG